jgi:ubiquitin C-terminal hydrolase
MSNFVGLPNIGNTCYANSVFQILASLPIPIPKEIYRKDSIPESKLDLSIQLYELINDIRCLKRCDAKKYICLMKNIAIHYPQFALGAQNDQNEFFNTMLSLQHECISSSAIYEGEQSDSIINYRLHTSIIGDDYVKRENNNLYMSQIIKLFSGQTINKTQCMNPSCGYISKSYHSFNTLELILSSNNLVDCIKNFLSDSYLDEHNMNQCKKCKVKSKAKISTELHCIPPIFVFTINRYATNKRGIIVKNSVNIHVPLSFEISSMKYELVASLHHVGSMRCGHCYAQIKSDINGGWVIIDDGKVIPLKKYNNNNIYMLFYKKND